MWSDAAEGCVELNDQYISTNEDMIIHNVNLNSAADKTIDGSGIDMDTTITQDKSCSSETRYDQDTTGYKTVSNNKNSNKRHIENTSPEEPSASKFTKTTESTKVENSIFLKGINTNITKQHPLAIKKALLVIDSTIRDDQIKYSKESIRINCRDEAQKIKFKNVSNLIGIEISISEHSSISRSALNLEHFEKVIIFGVLTEITEEEIRRETKAISVKRLSKKGSVEGERTDTESVILAYGSEPPRMVQIGFQTYKTKTFIPLPTRCWRCQRFGHAESSCRGKVTCPRCAGNHKYEECSIKNDNVDTDETIVKNTHLRCVNCSQQHSAAYRNCPEYLKSKEIAKIKTMFKLTYSQATKKMKEDEIIEAQPLLSTNPITAPFEATAATSHSHYRISHPISTLPSTPTYNSPSISNRPLPLFQATSRPSFTLANFPPIINSTTSTPTQRPSLLPPHVHSNHNHPLFSPAQIPPTTLLPVPNHIENFLSNLIYLLIDLLTSYLPSQSIVSKLSNLCTLLSTKANTNPIPSQSQI